MRPLPADFSDTTVTLTSIDGPTGSVPICRYQPVASTEGRAALPALVWVHGGGFFAGGLHQPESHAVSLALASRGMPVVSVDYRLVPPPGLSWARSLTRRRPVRFPLPMHDVLAVIREVDGKSPNGIIVGGASAGACLAAAAILSAVDHSVSPRGAVFAYGFFHPVHPAAPEIQRLVRGRRRITHSRRALNLMNRNYVGSATALGDRLAFPGGHDLRGFPTTLIINAERDSMRASGDRFAGELAAAGVEVDHHVIPGTRHAFFNTPRHAAFEVGMDLIAGWAKDVVPRSPDSHAAN